MTATVSYEHVIDLHTGEPSAVVLRRVNVSGTSSFVPVHPKNPDYHTYLKWVTSGNASVLPSS